MKRLLLFLTILSIAVFCSGQTYSETEVNDTQPQSDVIPVEDPQVTVLGFLPDETDVDWYEYHVYDQDNLDVLILSGNVDVLLLDSASAPIAQFGFSWGPMSWNYTANEPPPGILVPNWMVVSSAFGYVGPYEILIVNNTNNTLPVELSSFVATETATSFVSLQWVTQSESNMMGYNVYRAEAEEISGAVKMNASIIQSQNMPVETTYEFVDEEVEVSHTYWYWLESVETSGEVDTYGPASVTLTGGPDGGDTPDVIWVTMLENNFPNPFNPSTTLSYTLAEESDVTISVFNAKGEKITVLRDHRGEGRHTISWDGKTSEGVTCPSGVYLFRFKAGEVNTTSRGLLLK